VEIDDRGFYKKLLIEIDFRGLIELSYVFFDK